MSTYLLDLANRYLEPHPTAVGGDDPRSRKYALATRSRGVGADMSGFGMLTVTWVTKVSDLYAFVVEFDRMPRENNRLEAGVISAREKCLHEFVRYQRRAATREAHSNFEIQILEAIPGWSWNPHDDAWKHRFAEYKKFLLAETRAPRSRSAERHEKLLAAWAATQRRVNRQGKLSNHRQDQLVSLSVWAW